MKAALTQWARVWRDGTGEEKVEKTIGLAFTAVLVVAGVICAWRLGYWIAASGTPAQAWERTLVIVLGIVSFAALFAQGDWQERIKVESRVGRVVRAIMSGLVGGAAIGGLFYLGTKYLPNGGRIDSNPALIGGVFGVLCAPFFVAGDWKRSLATVQQSVSDVFVNAIIRGVLFATIALLTVVVVEGLIGVIIGVTGWRFADLVGVRFFEFLVAAAVGCGVGVMIFRSDARHFSSTVSWFTWSDVERGRWLTSGFFAIPARLSVEAIGDGFVVQHRQMPRSWWTMSALRIGLAVAVTLFFGHGLMKVIDTVEGIVRLRGLVTGAVSMVSVPWLGDLLAFPDDVTLLVPWLLALLLVYRLAWRTIATRWPGSTVTIGRWQDLDSFSVAPRADHYGGGGPEARPAKGVVLLANFLDGSSHRIADSEGAAVTMHALHTALTDRFIDGRTLYFEKLKAQSRAARHAVGERVKVY